MIRAIWPRIIDITSAEGQWQPIRGKITDQDREKASSNEMFQPKIKLSGGRRIEPQDFFPSNALMAIKIQDQSEVAGMKENAVTVIGNPGGSTDRLRNNVIDYHATNVVWV